MFLEPVPEAIERITMLKPLDVPEELLDIPPEGESEEDTLPPQSQHTPPPPSGYTPPGVCRSTHLGYAGGGTYTETTTKTTTEKDCGANAPGAAEPPAPESAPIKEQKRGRAKQKKPLTPKELEAQERREKRKTSAVVCARSVAGFAPNNEILDDIIRVLGPNPDKEKLAECRKEWVRRGYNPRSWVWCLEWYEKGIPPQGPAAYKGNGATRTNGTNAKPLPKDPTQETDWVALARQYVGEGKSS